MPFHFLLENLSPEIQDAVRKLVDQFSDPQRLKEFLGLLVELDQRAESGDITAELALQPLLLLSRLTDFISTDINRMALEDIVSVTEAANRLGISRAGVVKALNEERLKGQKLGGQWVIPIQEVENYRVAEHRVRAGRARRGVSRGWFPE